MSQLSIYRYLYQFVKLIRPKQWIKNGFVLAPLIFSGQFTHIDIVIDAIIAMGLFCIASSAVYIVNDMKDIERDRLHPRKSKTRPLAAGTLSIRAAAILLSILYIILLCGWFINPQVMMIIIGYILLNLAYSIILKHQPVLDIFTIAIGFVLRVYAGAMALNVSVSSWMFITTLCLALYLAIIKRRGELHHMGDESRQVLKYYTTPLINYYEQISASGSLFFYSMFVMSSKPELIITIPMVLFGLFRYWFVVETLNDGQSPTDTLLYDWPLLTTVILWVGTCSWFLLPSH